MQEQNNNAGKTPLPSEPASQDEHTATSPAEVPYPKRIRSFVMRAGRTTEAQSRAFKELGEQYLIPYTNSICDWDKHFSRTAPLILEIGFGMGEATAHIAALKKNLNFIACEVHPPGVGKLMLRLEEQQLSNVRIVQHDAVEVLGQMVEPASLAGVHIFFPDPWHKKRHNKRRLIQAPLVELLTSRMKPGAYIHCATDWQPYAEQILEVLNAQPALQNTAPNGQYAEKPDYRPLTKFEQRGLRLGHGVWDIVFTKK